MSNDVINNQGNVVDFNEAATKASKKQEKEISLNQAFDLFVQQMEAWGFSPSEDGWIQESEQEWVPFNLSYDKKDEKKGWYYFNGIQASVYSFKEDALSNLLLNGKELAVNYDRNNHANTKN